MDSKKNQPKTKWTEGLAKEVFYNRFTHLLDTMNNSKKFNPMGQNLYLHAPSVEKAAQIAKSLTGLDTGYQVELEHPMSLAMHMKRSYVTNVRKIAEDNIRVNIATDKALGVYKMNVSSLRSNPIFEHIEEIRNPMNMIRFDLYQNPLDIGSFSKRMLTEEFYSSNILAQTNEAIFHINNGLKDDKQLAHVPLTNIEREYQAHLLNGDPIHRYGKTIVTNPVSNNKLKDTFGYTEEDLLTIRQDMSPHTGDEAKTFRDFVFDLNERLDKTIGEMNRDRGSMGEVKDILRNADAQQKGIFDLIDEQYSTTRLGQYILDGSNGSRSDDTARAMMRFYLMDADIMANPLSIGLPATKDNKTLLDSVNGKLNATYDASQGEFKEYHRAAELRQVTYNMMNELYAQRSEANTDSRSYISQDRDTFEIDAERQTLNNMYNESIRSARIEEENDRSFREHKRALEKLEKEKRPKQPMSQFRNVFAMHFLETGSEEAKAIASANESEIVKMLQSGQDRYKEALTKKEEHQKALQEVQANYEEAKTKLTVYNAEHDNVQTDIYKQQQLSEYFARNFQTEIADPLAISEKEALKNLQQRIQSDPLSVAEEIHQASETRNAERLKLYMNPSAYVEDSGIPQYFLMNNGQDKIDPFINGVAEQLGLGTNDVKTVLQDSPSIVAGDLGMSTKSLVDKFADFVGGKDLDLSPVQEADTEIVQKLKEQATANEKLDSINAYNQFKEQLNLSGLQEQVKAKEELVKANQAIIDTQGYDSSSDITQKSYNELRSLYGYEGANDGLKKITNTFYNPVGLNEANEDKWLQAQEKGERIRIGGSQVGYIVNDINNGLVTLQADHVLASDIEIQAAVDPEKLDEVLASLDERRVRSSIKQDEIKEMADAVVRDQYINVVYEQKAVSQTLRDKNEFLYTRFKETEDHLLASGIAKPDMYGKQEINVNTRDVLHQYEVFTKNLTEIQDQTGIKNRARLPYFLYDMIQSNAPWMVRKGSNDELMSTAEVAFRNVLDDLSKNQTTLDLTDEGMLEAYRKSQGLILGDNATPKQIANAKEKEEAFLKTLSEKSLKDRMDDTLFMRVLPQVLQENFHPNGSNPDGQGGIRNLIEEAARTLEISQDHVGGYITADMVHGVLHSPDEATKAIFNANPYYKTVLGYSVQQIEGVMGDRAKKAGVEVSIDPMWIGADEDTYASDIDQAWRDFGGYGVEDGLDAQENKVIEQVGVDTYNSYARQNYEEALTRLEGNPEGTALLKYGYGDGTFEDALDARMPMAPEDFEEQMAAKRKQQYFEELESGKLLGSTDEAELLLDMSHASDSVEINKVLVNGQEGTLFKGTNGDLIVHLERDNKTVAVVNSSKEAEVRQPHVNDVKPERMYGETAIKKDIGEGGVPTRGQLLPYDTIQGTGDYTIPTNPDVSIDTLQKFLGGKGTMTYLDIETTGLSGSTIDPKYIQPIEVFMQKVQWDTENGGFLKNADGEFIIRHGGKETVRELQILTPLTEDTKGFMKDIIKNESFNFNVGDKTFNVAQYENPEMKVMIDEQIASQPNKGEIRQTIREQTDKLWFLRNIAKYSFAGDITEAEKARYRQYAGNDPIDPTRTTEFIEGLKEDANKASENLKKTNLHGKERVAFSDVQVGTDMDGVIKHVSRFVGKGPVVGQNVAKADWQKFMDYTETKVSNATDLINATQDSLLKDVAESREQNLKELKDIVRQVGMNKRSLGADRTQSKMLIKQLEGAYENGDDYKVVFDNFMDAVPEKAEALKALSSVYTESPYKNNITLQIMDNLNKLGEINTFESALRAGNPLTEPGDVPGQFVPKMNELREHQAALSEAQALQAKLPSPKIVEQQYMYRMLNGDAIGASAEAQFEAMGVEVDDSKGLHTARTDVKNALVLVEQYGQDLAKNQEFMDYKVEALQPGDTIELLHSVNRETPLGIYDVKAINPTGTDGDIPRYSVQLTDTDGKDFTILGSSASDLAQKMRNNTQFVGTADEPEKKEQMVQRFMEDQGRRQIDRATSNADVFDKYELEMNQLKEDGQLTHPELTAANQRYQELKQSVVGSDGATSITGVSDSVIAENGKLFEGTRILDLLDEEASLTKQKGFEMTEPWMQTNEAQSRRGFLNEVRSMERAGAIDTSTSRDMIRQMNQAIKEEGFARGAKHSVFNTANLGTLDSRFGDSLAGTPLVAAENNPSQIQRALWGLAEKTKWMMNDENPETAKASALNQLVFPWLKEQGLIKWEDDTKQPRMQNVVREIMSHDLPEHEEFDYMKSAELFDNNEDYRNFILNKQNEILEPVRNNMTLTQKARANDFNETVKTLRNEGIYHPSLQINPSAEVDVKDSFNFGKYGGITNYPIGELTRQAELLKEGIIEDESARNTIYGELYNRATNGQRIDVNEVISHDDSEQLRALEALNWVTNDGGEYKPNADVASHYMGVPGKYAGYQLGSKEIPYSELNSIADQINGDYTKGNAKTMVKEKIENWRDEEGNYPGKSLQSPDNNLVKSRLAQSNAETKAQGEMARAMKESVDTGSTAAETIEELASKERSATHYNTTNLDANRAFEHSNVISESIKDAKQSVRNLATDLMEGTTGKALKWVGGLGLAAFAIQQLHNAQAPMKLERKEMAHGVEGPTGQPNDGLEETPQHNPSLGDRSYVNPGGSGSKGHRIRVEGQADNHVNYKQMNDDIGSEIGTFNINMHDNRETMDRSWLENQFSNYITRGSVGND